MSQLTAEFLLLVDIQVQLTHVPIQEHGADILPLAYLGIDKPYPQHFPIAN